VHRKQLLKQVLAGALEPLIYVEYLEAEGDRVFHNACKIGLTDATARITSDAIGEGCLCEECFWPETAFGECRARDKKSRVGVRI
jgi:hypothetical protein